MEYSKEDKRKYLILQCRYYKGESKPPSTLPEGYALMWKYESKWVEWTLHEDEMLSQLEHDIQELHLETKEGDKTPLTLKALMCNRYLYWGGYVSLEEELKIFEQWYVDFYQLWKTNREQRADKRKPELIAKCRLYHGEERCPYDNQNDILAWTWEKEWVEALADSWLNRDKYQHDYVHLPEMQPFSCKDLNQVRKRAEMLHIPFTMYLYFAIQFAKGYVGGFKHEMEEYFDHWIVDYSKH